LEGDILMLFCIVGGNLSAKKTGFGCHTALGCRNANRSQIQLRTIAKSIFEPPSAPAIAKKEKKETLKAAVFHTSFLGALGVLGGFF